MKSDFTLRQIVVCVYERVDLASEMGTVSVQVRVDFKSGRQGGGAIGFAAKLIIIHCGQVLTCVRRLNAQLILSIDQYRSLAAIRCINQMAVL